MQTMREPMGMFLVLVDPNSKVEKLLGIASMAPYFIMCSLTTLIVRSRELVVCSWLGGHLLNEVLNFCLKRLLKEERPMGAPAVGFDIHGMPSAHSQFMGFYFCFSSCILAYRVRNCSPFWKVGAASFNLGLTLVVGYGRIRLGFHTPAQVVVGLGVGCAAGLFYYASCSRYLFPLFPAVARWKASRLALLRDALDVDNVIQFEYDAYDRLRKEQ